LGVKTDLTAAQMGRCVEEAGIGFLFAPALHPAMKQAAPVRKELGVRTVFNVLGPLTNPAGAKRQLLGVFSPRLVPLMAHALGELGSEEAMVVSSRDGMDELSLRAPASVAHLKNGRVEEYELDPAAYGFKKREAGAFAGGDAAANARILLSVLKGDEGGPLELTLWNAAAALMAAGLASDMKQGLEKTKESVKSGKALKSLEALKKLSQA
jgi:anthranilate phosphoribosyltransferase